LKVSSNFIFQLYKILHNFKVAITKRYFFKRSSSS